LLSPNHCFAVFCDDGGLTALEKEGYSHLKCMAGEWVHAKTDLDQVCVVSKPICSETMEMVSKGPQIIL